MISAPSRTKYHATIGIETHVQLKTKTKLFAAVDNDARTAAPNTLVSHICFGLPGALPVLNSEAVRLAARAGLALGITPARFSKFDRKHYFYPDLPKGYQISQYDEPIVGSGSIEVPIVDEATNEVRTMRVGITRAHLEEDAGKSTHPVGKDFSLVDLNRAGTPLLEIVSEPDMHSPAEAKAYVRELYLRMKYSDVSDCDLYLGHMRFDVNVSVSPDTHKLGTRSETKNLNSFRSVEKAAEYEINRQIELIEKGQQVIQETRGWDEAKQRTLSQRTKEEAHDYRYMPDPDLPPIILDEAFIAGVRHDMPPSPSDYRQKFNVLDVERKVIEDILTQPNIAQIVSHCTDKSSPQDARRIAFWLLQYPVAESEREVSLINVDEAELIHLSRLAADNKLNSTSAKVVVDELLLHGGKAEEIATSKHLFQMSDEKEIIAVVQQVLKEHPEAVADVRSGETKAIAFLVGQVMKLSRGTANPTIARNLIQEALDVPQ